MTPRILFIGLMLLTPFVGAQPYFEGTMNFSVEFEGEMAQMLSDNEPNEQIIMHIKNGDYIVQLRGGRYPKTFLFIADSNYEYSIDQANNRAFRYGVHHDLNMETHELEQQYSLKAQPTGETAEVKGRECEIYRFRKPDAVFFYYVSDDYRVDMNQYPSPSRSKAAFLIEGLDGRIPLKTVRKEADLTVITTLTSINERAFNEAQFRIPADFTVKKRDYRY